LTEDRKETVGQYLRQEREKRNISLETVAKVTRITRENLEALEKDDFQKISAPVFVRGFLRNYANYLGLDPKDLVDRYDAQSDLLNIPRAKEVSQPTREENRGSKYIVFLAVLLVGVGISFYLIQKSSTPPSPPAAISPPSGPTVQQPSPKGIVPPGKAISKAIHPDKEKPGEGRHVLKAVVTEKTWMRVRADDQQIFDVLLQPKETVTWTARSRFAITVGNAGGVELSLNGIPQGPLGKSGEVIHLALPKEAQGMKPPQEGPGKPPALPKTLKPSSPVPAEEAVKSLR
jgi:transcriptional regulator with XRE-family HTH domain